ncbi:MAG: PepSY domain-containing protein [Methylococcales bacterium]
MKHHHGKTWTALLALIIMTGGGANLAQAAKTGNHEARELRLFSQAGISLTEAITAAEQKTGGKAFEAELDDEANTVQFEVETIKDGKIQKVMVNAQTGKVLRVALDEESDEGIEKIGHPYYC